MRFKHFITIFITALAIIAGQALAATDTVYVQKRITDTIYVVSPPDTVYIQESVIHQAKVDSSAVKKNEFILDYSTDTIPPGRKFYIGGTTALSIFSIWFGALLLDFTWELENTYRGSLLFTYSSIMLFGEYNLRHEDPSWEGFRSILSPGVGYRHYLFTFDVGKTNPKKQKIKFRNTPLNSYSFYIQALGSPTFKIAYDKSLPSEQGKSGSVSVGVFASATLGGIWNMFNMLWDTGISFGYQYWGNKSRNYLDISRSGDEINYRIQNGWCGKGFFIGTDIKLGF